MAALPQIALTQDLYILRHGETEWNTVPRIQGRKNSPLTEKGRAQAKQQAKILSEILPNLKDCQLISSPLGRTIETATIAFGNRNFVLEPRIQEVNCGAWEGLTHEEMRLRDPDLFAAAENEFALYTNAPDGERLPDLALRTGDFLQTLRGCSVLISHKVVITVMRALLTGENTYLDCSQSPPQGSVMKISNGKCEIISD